MRLISNNGVFDIPYEYAIVCITKSVTGAHAVEVVIIGDDEPITLCLYRKKYDAEASVARMRDAYVRGDKFYQFKNATT